MRSKFKESNNADFLIEHANEGFETLEARDFVIPFLRVLQKLTPQADEDSVEYVDGARPGLFFNTVNQKVYGNALQVIPLTFKKTWLEWQPNRGGLVGRHEPFSIKVDRSDFSHWKPFHNPENSIVETMLFFVLLEGHFSDGPLVFPLSKTGIKHGRNWNTQIMMTRLPTGQRAPYYSSVWKLETVLNKNDAGSWYQIGGKKTAVSRVRFITLKEFTDYVNPIKDSIQQVVTQIDFNQIEDTTAKDEELGPKIKSKTKGEQVPFTKGVQTPF